MLGNKCLVFALTAIIANSSHALPCKKTWGVVSIKTPLLILSVIAWAPYFKQNYSFSACLNRSITPHLNRKHFADSVTEGPFLLCRKQVKSNEMGVLYLILKQGENIDNCLLSEKGFTFMLCIWHYIVQLDMNIIQYTILLIKIIIEYSALF